MAELKGARELQALLDSIPAKIEANIVRGGLRAGAKVLLSAIKESAPVDEGHLVASVRISTSLRKGQVRVFVKVGDKKAWYAHFIEFGTQPHAMSAESSDQERRLHPGARPNPFIRVAYDSNEQQALEAAISYMRNRLKTKHGLETPDNDET